MTLHRQWFRILALAIVSISTALAEITPQLEHQIVELYSSGQCSKTEPLIAHEKIENFRPNIIAVIASCKTSHEQSEALFKIAEKKDPDNDLVALLHARSLQFVDPNTAKPYWVHVQKYARSDSLREMAREALSGLEINKAPLNLSSWTWTVQAQIGGSHHSSPWVRETPDHLYAPGNALDLDLFLRAQHWIKPGSISATYKHESHLFFGKDDASTQSHLFEIPLALRVGRSEDLVFKPFFQQKRVGSDILSNAEGIGFTGIAYRESSKQTVSGFAATEQTLLPDVNAPDLAHYHFDYQWEWFPVRWLLVTKFGVDNYSASRIAKYRNVSGDFNESHNDLSLSGTVRHGFDRFSLGLSSSVLTRFDNHDSTFMQPTTHQVVTKSRNDYSIELEPHVIWRVLPQLQLYLYAQQIWNRTNLDKADYGFSLDHDETILGLKLRTYWSSY